MVRVSDSTCAPHTESHVDEERCFALVSVSGAFKSIEQHQKKYFVAAVPENSVERDVTLTEATQFFESNLEESLVQTVDLGASDENVADLKGRVVTTWICISEGHTILKIVEKLAQITETHF